MLHHCWTGKGEWLSDTYGEFSEQYGEYIAAGGMSETCMLAKGHEGPHEFVPDDQIIITFKE